MWGGRWIWREVNLEERGGGRERLVGGENYGQDVI